LPKSGLSGLSRREVLSAALHSAPALISLGSPAIASWQLEHFRVRRLEVPLPDLPPELHGFTITHLSDTHVGRFTHGRVLSAIVETTQALDSDLICFTGDLINFSLGDLPPGIEMLQALKARHGVYLCEGNHDLMHNAAAFRRAVEKASLRLLVGDSETFTVAGRSVQILGLPWNTNPERLPGPETHGADPMKSLAQKIQPGAFPILLAHHPHAFDAAEDFRLTLSGHTHGGQLMLTPRFGCGPAFYRYWSGLHRKKNRALCVSNGVGNWFPIRISAPAEIVHLTLRAAAS
jgi:predicted MPP superfamily phosphohydrolase